MINKPVSIMYTEDELLPISALQHMAFCERQAALIHIENVWEENVLTAEGRILHERTHCEETEIKGNIRISRGLRLRSLELGLIGIADVVEFHGEAIKADGCEKDNTIELPGLKGRWQSLIIEYKHGAPKPDHIDEVQLCAQAVCLEEMLGVCIPSSSFFYGRPRRRHSVNLDDDLRTETRNLAVNLHAMIKSGKTPVVAYSQKCRNCSLLNLCLPKAMRPAGEVEAYIRSAITGGDET